MHDYQLGLRRQLPDDTVDFLLALKMATWDLPCSANVSVKEVLLQNIELHLWAERKAKL